MRYMLSSVMLFLLGTFITTRCYGQSFTVHHYGVQEGLPSSEVYDVFQDSKGFLWFSTDNGVAKFDGYNLKLYNASDSLPDPVVFETLEDQFGKIWFRTLSGRIAYFENDNIFPYQYNKQLSKVCEGFYLGSMVLDQTGTLWFAAGNKWGKVNSKGEISFQLLERDLLFYKTVDHSSILAAFGTEKGFTSILIDGKQIPIKLSHNQKDPRYSHTVKRALVWRNNIYVTINNNIFMYDGKTVSLVYIAPAAIINLSIDREDNIWVGLFNGGAVRFATEDFKNGWTPSFIEGKSVTKVIQDHEGGIWMTTLENGAYYIPNKEIKNYSLHSNSKIKTVGTHHSTTTVGEIDGTLRVIDSQTLNIILEKKFQRSLLSLYENETSKWVSMAGTLYIFDRHLNQLKRSHPGNYVAFSPDKDGNIWGTEAKGVSKFDSDGNLIKSILKRLPHRTILVTDSLLIIGLHTGLNIYDLKLNLLKSPTEFNNYKISQISQLNDSTFLVATIGNGFIIAKNDFKNLIHYKDPVKNINSVIKTDSSIWLGTEKGVVKVNKTLLLKNKLAFEWITKQSGLVSNQVNLLSKDSANNILVFYDQDYSVIKSGHNKFSNKTPKFYFDNLNVNDKKLTLLSSIKLPYDSNNIQMKFGFISFNNQNIITRYRIRNTDQWIYPIERTINLFSLSPGLYSPELQYSSTKEIWTNVALPIILIRSPWWQTLWFQLGLSLTLFMIGLLFLYNRIIIYRQRNEKMKLITEQQQILIQTELSTLERERLRIARDLHDGISPNILVAKLTSKNIIKKYEPENIGTVETQFETVLKAIKDIVYDLYPPELSRFGLQEGLKNYIDRISNASEIKITFNSVGEDFKDLKITLPVFRILQELITNSLKHSKADHITINLSSSIDVIKIVYKDNGTGFIKGEIQAGLGLHSIESRVLTLKGNFHFESINQGVFYSFEFPTRLNSDLTL